jgi:DNA-binding CsgD family transcriptional regulator
MLARQEGAFDRAAGLLDESLGLYRELGDRRGMALTLTNLGTVALRQGDAERARALHDEARILFRDLGDAPGLVGALIDLGLAFLKLGDTDRAGAACAEGLVLAHELGDREQMATTLEYLAAVAATGGQEARAVRLCAAADRLRQEIGVHLPPAEQAEHDQRIGSACVNRSSPILRAAWEEGRRLTADEAVAFALSSEPPIGLDRRAPEDPRASKTRDAPSGLTPRELDVLRLLVEGRTDREIAEELFIGHRTVASHVAAILGKIGVDSRTAAATYAVRHGYV